ASEQLMLADRDYLMIGGAKDEERNKLIAATTAEYTKSWQNYAMIVLKYYVQDEVAPQTYPIDPKTGQRYTRETIGNAPADQFIPTLQEAGKLITTAFV